MVERELNNNKGNKYHKTNEKAPILQCTFLHKYLDFFEKIAHYNQTPFKNSAGQLKTPIFHGETCTTILQVFWFGSNTKHIYLFVELWFLFHLGTH